MVSKSPNEAEEKDERGSHTIRLDDATAQLHRPFNTFGLVQSGINITEAQ